jgi:hypothetical protein
MKNVIIAVTKKYGRLWLLFPKEKSDVLNTLTSS